VRSTSRSSQEKPLTSRLGFRPQPRSFGWLFAPLRLCVDLGLNQFTQNHMKRDSSPTSISLLFAFALGMARLTSAAEWQPAAGPLLTRWAKDVSPKNAHPEYPRPQMVRKDWQNLNGLWDYAITAKDAAQPTQWDGQILVPFPIESALSGVMKRVYETNLLWYRRTFTIPRGWKGKNVLLNFGAVDWETTVFVNGKQVGTHRGGYDGFTFDITDALKPKAEQEIIVSVWDPTDAGYQPRGKQVRKPGGIWYTPTSGIWQTVWLEPVNVASILGLKLMPNVDAERISIETLYLPPPGKVKIRVEVLDGSRRVQAVNFEQDLSGGNYIPRKANLVAKIPEPKLWSPNSPYLYGLRIALYADARKADEVESYFAMRKISLGKDELGHVRLCLNNKPFFMLGPLDQGFWPDGIYTAPTDEALRHDIEVTKRLGFNMCRKHVKVEPDRWYYWADKLGLLVCQDMPSGDKFIRGKDADITRTPESAAQFEAELKALVEGRFNHPCIVMWVPYNEGWGQWDTCRVVDQIKQWDPTRLVDDASGWADRGCGDVHDMHKYPGPGAPVPEENRAGVLGEFGGLGLPIKGHTWQAEKNWGYRSFTNATALTKAYLGLVEQLPGLIRTNGLSAAVYTQTTDCEIEVNGLMTYDRAVVKMNQATVAAVNKKICGSSAKDAPQK
jgi:Glycosyl hydrolases family 2, sugar binding domain/Glycosyl hydrolases family 2, TIM barrel domain/Glycosyl hydrolases family 2